MREDIELSIDTKDGVIDIRFEPDQQDEMLYHATILYPSTIEGNSRSEIFCYDMKVADKGGRMEFVYSDEGLHPKIAKLEDEINAQLKLK